MKKLLFALMGLLFLCPAFSQCWQNPDCSNPVSVTGILSNQNYNGSTCFDGSGIINNSVNVNNWQYLSYSGALDVRGPVNMNNKTNVFVNGAIIFDQVHWTGGDTLFINGSVVISKVVSNNSNTNSRNVIMLSETSSLVIDGKPYTIGSTVATSGNTSNEIDVTGCKASTLPVTLSSITISKGILSWETGVQSDIDGYVIQGSQDAQQWTDLDTVEVNASGSYSYSLHNSKLASFGLVFIVLLLGMLVPSKKLRIGAVAVAFIGFSLISCSKDNASVKDSTYQYYRIKILNTNGNATYSKVIRN